jgi:hypothetical protein
MSGLPGSKRRMSDSSPILRLSSLPLRHPCLGDICLDDFGPSTVLRLGVDPILLPPGVTEQTIIVDWRPFPTKEDSIRFTYRIAWDDLPRYNQDYLRRLRLCRNEQQITETAALGIMALLIHEIEKLSILTVQPIGGGTDYEAACGGKGPGVSVEVRGIRQADTFRMPQARLREKTAQALEKNQRPSSR